MTKKKHEHDTEHPIKEELQNGPDAATSVAQLAVDPKDAKIAELTDTLQRLQADFENYKKRVDKENQQYAKYSNMKLIANMLPLLDSFELAIKNANGSDISKFRKGVELIFAQFFSMLEKEGLRPINAVNQKLDPYKHEVLMQQECEEKQDGIVLEEFQKGYMFNDAVIRHSKVKIGKRKMMENESSKN